MKYHILFVGPTPPPYHGCSVMNENFLQSELPKKFNIIFLDTADRRGISNISSFDLTNIFLALYYGLKFIYLLICFNPELVYLSISQGLWGYLRDLLFLLPARFVNKKILIHLHGSAFHDFYRTMPWFLKMLTKYVFKGKVWGIVLGESLRCCFKGLINSEKIFVVPNGIRNISKCDASSASMKNKIHILYLANLMRSKGFMNLLEIIPDIVSQYPEVSFTFAGEKPQNGELKNIAEFISKNHLEEIVHMPGVITGKEKERFLLNSDIFVFPPIGQEGQPLVIIEAMAAGLPVIATDRGAIPETVLDGITGFVVSNEDKSALLDRTFLLIKDESLRQKMGLEGKKRFQNQYQLDLWVSNLQSVFRRVLEIDYNSIKLLKGIQTAEENK